MVNKSQTWIKKNWSSVIGFVFFLVYSLGVIALINLSHLLNICNTNNDKISNKNILITVDALITTATVTLIAFNGIGARNSGSSTIIRIIFWKAFKIESPEKRTRFFWNLTGSFLRPAFVLMFTLISTISELIIIESWNSIPPQFDQVSINILFSVTVILFVSTVFRLFIFNASAWLETSAKFISTRLLKKGEARPWILNIITYFRGTNNFELIQKIIIDLKPESIKKDDILKAIMNIKRGKTEGMSPEVRTAFFVIACFEQVLNTQEADKIGEVDWKGYRLLSLLKDDAKIALFKHLTIRDVNAYIGLPTATSMPENFSEFIQKMENLTGINAEKTLTKAASLDTMDRFIAYHNNKHKSFKLNRNTKKLLNKKNNIERWLIKSKSKEYEVVIYDSHKTKLISSSNYHIFKTIPNKISNPNGKKIFYLSESNSIEIYNKKT